MSSLTSTVTFLFTDIEGSTKLWEKDPEGMAVALARHDALVRQAIETNGGNVFKTIGDAFCAAFENAHDALAASLEAQLALQSEAWQMPIRVRMALHTGDAQVRENDYFGPAVNRVARLLAIGHGGQTLLSETTCELVQESLPAGVSLRNMGLHRLKDLQQPQQVYQLLHPDLETEFPALRSLTELPNNLPQQVTGFIGREGEIAEVKQLLETTRLLTLTGSGGCGKTRLALQVAADLLGEYPEGVWLVELAPLADPSLVPQAVASALGVREERDRLILQTLSDYLKTKQLLLILDNCEHLLTTCAQLADVLLRSCPKLRILASSREGLGIMGERTYRVPSLSVPDPKKWAVGRVQSVSTSSLMEYESVRLFVERAQAAQPHFNLTDQNAPAIAQICARLDGIPLAIELASVRVKAIPVEQIAARLDDRFRLLTGGSRTALPRQQTLRALIDWSYDLLSQEERTLLRRLSVFVSGFTLEAAEAICSDEEVGEWENGRMEADISSPLPLSPSPILPYDVLDLLANLVDKSLVVYENESERYRLLETVRQYARDRLLESGEGEATRRRHRDYFLRWAEEAGQKLRGPEQATWFDRLETEHDNLRAALTWAIESEEAEIALRLASAMGEFWYRRGHLREGRDWLETALACSGEASSSIRARALIEAGTLANLQGDFVGVQQLLEEGRALAQGTGDRQNAAFALIQLGVLAFKRGERTEARTFYEQSLALYRELEDSHGIAQALVGLGNVVWYEGDTAGARALYEESLALYRKMGDWAHIATTLHNVATLATFEAEFAKAIPLFEESLAIKRELGDRFGIALTLNNLATIAQKQGDFTTARAYFREAFALLWELGERQIFLGCLMSLAGVYAAQGEAERAAHLFGAAEMVQETFQVRKAPTRGSTLEQDIAIAREALGESAFTEAWARGRQMTPEEAFAEAMREG